MYLKLSSEHFFLIGSKSSLISCSSIWHYRTPSTKGIINLFIDSDKRHSHTFSVFLYHQATIISNTHTTLNVISKSGMVPNFTKRFQIISIVKPTRCTNVSNLFYFGITLHFGWSFHPSSGVHNCTYSNKHMSNRYCYCLLASSSSICLTCAYCCMYSCELLMTPASKQ